jgi:hypothetical protein
VKAVLYERAAQFEVTEVPDPEPPAGAVRVRLHATGTHRFALDGFGDALEAVRADPTCRRP